MTQELNILNGTHTETHPNGDIVTSEWLNGVENGVRIVKTKDGMCKELLHFRNGLLDGEQKIWHAPYRTSDHTSDSGIYKKLYMIDGKLESEDDLPSEIVYDMYSNKIVAKKWHRKGKLHCDFDLPAYIVYDGDKIAIVRWYCDGKVYRDRNLPVEIGFNTAKTTRPNTKYISTKISVTDGKNILEQTVYEEDGIRIRKVYTCLLSDESFCDKFQ